jgi:hypothetical protein
MDATHQKETYKFMDVPPFPANIFPAYVTPSSCSIEQSACLR